MLILYLILQSLVFVRAWSRSRMTWACVTCCRRISQIFQQKFIFLEFEVVWGLLLTLLLTGLFRMCLHGFGSLDFVAASQSNGSQAKLCSVTSKVKNFSHSLIPAMGGGGGGGEGAIKAFKVFNYSRMS